MKKHDPIRQEMGMNYRSGGDRSDRSPILYLFGRIFATLTVIAGVLTVVWLASGCSAKPENPQSRYGIQIQSVRLSAAGYMVDLRYKILDAKKAAKLTQRGTKTYLVDQATGQRFATPTAAKVGSLRNSSLSPKEGRTYFAFFANPGKALKPGVQVQVVMGDFHSAPLVVE
ncbi:MAG: hypothetical protein GX444_18760 [Myxococcales bacterium]|nr:hypothetical protein [Myxococcales bacterium]